MSAILYPLNIKKNCLFRNIFFRTSYLLLLGVKPVFVLEGEVPEIKTATMMQRLNRGKESSQAQQKKVVRRRLTALQKQVFIPKICLRVEHLTIYISNLNADLKQPGLFVLILKCCLFYNLVISCQIGTVSFFPHLLCFHID